MSRPGAVIVGGSSGVGRALATELAMRGHDLVLAARDVQDLEAVASDVAIRWAIEAHPCPLDLGSAEPDVAAFREECERRLDGIDAVFLTVGQIDAADCGPTSLEVVDRLTRVNYVSVVKLVSEFARLLEARDAGRIVVFSSIAAAAPRRRNTVYSSAKGGLELYCRGLRHYFARSGVKIHVYALGYVDTTMTFGQDLHLPIAPPQEVARYVVDHLDREPGRRYLPRFWGLITLLLRHLPWFLYRRLRF